MTVKKLSEEEGRFVDNSLEAAVRIGLIFVIVYWCFDILKPFLMPILWGIIIAVASYPIFLWLKGKLGGRNGLTSFLLTLFALSVIIIPSIMLSTTLVSGVEQLATELETGALKIPQPSEAVAGWPVIGEKVYAVWSLASSDIEQALTKFGPQLSSLGSWLLGQAKTAGMGLLQSIISIIIAGVLHANAKASSRLIENISLRLAGDAGLTYCRLSGKLIGSVTLGILGVATIQAVLAGIGFMVAGVPLAGLWAFIVLFLGVIQVGPMIVILPIAIYMMGELGTLAGILFLIWSIVVALLDNFLKPILLARGLDVPMIVIFLGAIGGFITMGFVGLFLGAIVLVLGWTLLVTWINGDSEEKAEEILGALDGKVKQ